MNKNIYLGLAVLGFVIPYIQLVSFIIEYGLDVRLMLIEIISSKIAAFGWLDVVITAIVIAVWVIEEKEIVSNWWISLIATFLIGPSCGLPLFLYMRKE